MKGLDRWQARVMWAVIAGWMLSRPAIGDEGLRRRGLFGAALVAAGPGAAPGGGVEVREVFAGSTADEAGTGRAT